METSDLLAEIYPRVDRVKALEALDPKPSGNYIELKCPKCGQRRAFIYHKGITLTCNRRNDCGYHSSLWDYVKVASNLGTPKEVLRALADLAGYTLPPLAGYSDERAQEERDKERLLEEAQSYFVGMLIDDSGKETLAYLNQRGYSQDDTFEMGLGFYPSQDELRTYLVNEGYSVNSVNESGLFTKNFGETHKLTIPYRDQAGRIQSFILRSLLPEETLKTDHNERKYKYMMGSKPSLQFFNMDKVRGARKLIIVEGYLDALITTIKGMGGVVSVGGDAPRESQIDHAMRYGAKQFILAMDKDRAGDQATENTLNKLNERGAKVYIAGLPEGYKDPDELTRAKGIGAFQEVIDKAESGATWKAKRLLSKHDLQGLQHTERDLIIEESIAFEETLLDSLDSKDFIDTITEGLGISPEILEPKLKDYHEKKAEERQRKAYGDMLVKANEMLSGGNLAGLGAHLKRELPSISAQGVARIIEPYSLEAFILQQQTSSPGLDTGYPSLQNYLTIPNGAITIIAGRPSHGKTTLLLNLFRNMIDNYRDKRFVFFSYEETWPQLIARYINMLAGVELDQYRNKDKLEEYFRSGKTDNRAIERAKGEYAELVNDGRLWLIDEPYYIGDLTDTIRYLCDRYGNVGGIFIDYIQKVKTNRSFPTRQVEIQHISAELLDTAKETGLPLILGAQSGRGVDSEKDVTLSSLRESGDIEQDANVVLGLWNEAFQKAEEDSRELTDKVIELKLKILKNRNGIVNKVIKLDFNTPILRIQDKSAGQTKDMF